MNDDPPIDAHEKMKRKVYEAHKRHLQIELLKVQRWTKQSGQRIAILFEGRDAAGKGGTIKRFMEHLNPRGARVVALEKPGSVEQGQWYFQRYVQQLPTAGEIVLFDRSWYNRAGVERVMGFCTDDAYHRFLHQTPMLERMLTDSGIWLFKFWLSISRAEQHRRIDKRRRDPLKHWKLSPIDEVATEKWTEYTEAREAMFAETDTSYAPWTVVRCNDKRRARLACMSHVLRHLPYPGKDARIIGPPDTRIVGPADTLFGRGPEQSEGADARE
jgi:polyphosphate kinase 2